jgi:hypothetical protein
MIWDLITGLLPNVWPYIAGAAVLVAGWFTAKRQGARAANAKSDRKALDKTVKGQEAARKGRAEAAGQLAKGKTPEEVRRQNDGKW